MALSITSRFKIGLLAGLFLTSTAAQADFWSDVARVVTAPVTAPIEMTKRVLDGDNPATVVQGHIGATGRIVTQVTNQASRAQDTFNSVQRGTIEQIFGSDWADAHGALMASQRIQMELGFTSGRYLGGCLQGQSCSPNQIVAAPVAASLRDAYKIYAPYSQPLDPNVQRILSYVFPAGQLANVRWVVGATPNMTVPGFLNYGHERFGGGHAVTIGNLIIFSRMPNLADRNDWIWLMHEIQHTIQYARASGSTGEQIDAFSVDYLLHYNSMENDADNVAFANDQRLMEICRFGC